MTANLTPKQKVVADRLRAYVDETGTAPTLDELASLCRVSKSTIRQYLAALEAKGYVRRERYGHRAIEFVRRMQEKRLPIAGRIAAGTPVFAAENIDGYLDSGKLFKSADFALRVRGDSMVDAGILDGDLVLVRIQPSVEDGEIAVCIVGNEEATLKRIYRERDGRIRLQPENRLMKPVVVRAADLVIQGKVVAVQRFLP